MQARHLRFEAFKPIPLLLFFSLSFNLSFLLSFFHFDVEKIIFCRPFISMSDDHSQKRWVSRSFDNYLHDLTELNLVLNFRMMCDLESRDLESEVTQFNIEGKQHLNPFSSSASLQNSLAIVFNNVSCVCWGFFSSCFVFSEGKGNFFKWFNILVATSKLTSWHQQTVSIHSREHVNNCAFGTKSRSPSTLSCSIDLSYFLWDDTALHYFFLAYFVITAPIMIIGEM